MPWCPVVLLQNALCLFEISVKKKIHVVMTHSFFLKMQSALYVHMCCLVGIEWNINYFSRQLLFCAINMLRLLKTSNTNLAACLRASLIFDTDAVLAC